MDFGFGKRIPYKIKKEIKGSRTANTVQNDNSWQLKLYTKKPPPPAIAFALDCSASAKK